MPAGGGDPTSGVRSPAGRPLVERLLDGFWRVSDAAGETPNTWLRFGPREVALFRPRGQIDFGLAAERNAIVAHRTSWSMSLGRHSEAPWMSAAATIAADGSGWRLMDEKGVTVAHLARDGAPAPSTQYETDPTPPGPRRPALRNAVPGAGVVEVPTTALRGTWRLADHREAALTFEPDGSWSTKTSCQSGTGANAGAGGYRLLDDGFVLMTSGYSTLIGCYEPKKPSADTAAITDPDRARSVRIVGTSLTLFDVDGKALGTLVR